MRDLLNNQFRDAEGRTWTFNITVGTYRKIKIEEGIDITDVFSEGNWLQRVSSGEEVGLVLTLAILALQSSLDERNISMEAFCDALTGDALEDMADALIGGVVNFMPEHKRKPLVKTVEILNTEKKRASDVVIEKMDKIVPMMVESRNLETKLDKIIDSHLNESKNSSSEQPE